jgi:hypothetical protein
MVKVEMKDVELAVQLRLLIGQPICRELRLEERSPHPLASSQLTRLNASC